MIWFGRSTDASKKSLEDQSIKLANMRKKRKEALSKLMTALDEIPCEVPDDDDQEPEKSYDQKRVNGKNGYHGD